MRILFHHRTLADGAEGIHIAAMVDAFRALGHEVNILGVSPQRHMPPPSGLTSALRQALPSIATEAAAVLFNVPEYLAVRDRVRRFAPDFVYTRHARLSVGALAAASHAAVPSVLELNSLFTQGQYHAQEPVTLRRLAVRLEKRALTLATVVTAVSTPLARQAEAFGSVPVDVVANGVDATVFDPTRADPKRVRAEYGLGDAVTIGWSGIIREWHGLELLMDAAAVIPEARILVVGDGPGRASIERHVERLGLRQRVTITGRIAHREMPDYLAAMDIAVVADDRTAVASPMKMLEYMAMGRAVVAPRLDNIRDLVTDNSNGRLFTAGDSAALSETLQQLVNDASVRTRLGRNARESVVRERTWPGNAMRVISLVMRRHAGGAAWPQRKGVHAR